MEPKAVCKPDMQQIVTREQRGEKRPVCPRFSPALRGGFSILGKIVEPLVIQPLSGLLGILPRRCLQKYF
jgi:hypothetical protein